MGEEGEVLITDVEGALFACSHTVGCECHMCLRLCPVGSCCLISPLRLLFPPLTSAVVWHASHLYAMDCVAARAGMGAAHDSCGRLLLGHLRLAMGSAL